MITGQPDTDEDRDVYGQRLGPSAESLDAGRSSEPNLSDLDVSQYTTGSDPYPAWVAERNIPLSKEEIEEQQKFGFQRVLCGKWCVLNCVPCIYRCLYIYGHPGSISRCTCLTAVCRECFPTRHTLPFTRIT
jgi:hypothetical protein